MEFIVIIENLFCARHLHVFSITSENASRYRITSNFINEEIRTREVGISQPQHSQDKLV